KRRVLEAPLGQAPMQRHLAALEALDGDTRTRGLALAAAAAGLAHAGADAAADADPLLSRTRTRSNLIQLHRNVLVLSAASSAPAGYLSSPTTRTRWATLRIIPRVSAVSGRSLVRPILLSPSPISVSRWLRSRRIALAICSILMVLLPAI